MPERWEEAIRRLDELSPDLETLRNARPVTLDERRREPLGRRLVVVLVAFALAVVSFAFLASGFRRSAGPSPSAPSPSSFGSLWPLDSARLGATFGAKVVAEEAKALRGRDVWQLDPARTAIRFGREVFGWPEVLVVGSASNDDGTLSVTIGRATTCITAGPSGATASLSACPTIEHTLTMAQPWSRGRDGIWEVVEVRPVTASEYDLGLVPAQTVVPGERLDFSFGDVPPAFVGLVAGWPCSVREVAERVRVVDPNTSTASLTVPGPRFGTGCDVTQATGYVYAYTPLPPGSATDQPGDPLAGGIQVGEASIVPVTLRAPSGTGGPVVTQGVDCPLPTSSGRPDIGCPAAVTQAMHVASFAVSVGRAHGSERPEAVGEGSSVPAWFVTFTDVAYEAGPNGTGCSSSGTVRRYTVVVSATSGRLLAFDGPPEGCPVDRSPSPIRAHPG